VADSRTYVKMWLHVHSVDTSQLSPFLCSGFITAYFNLSVNTPQNNI